jgi:transcriptional regulator with XRE-family HTH domain
MKNRIKEIRKGSGETQSEFGNRVGVATATVSSWELGTRTPPKSVQRTICTEYHINEEWLKYGTGEKKAKPDALLLASITNEELIAEAARRIYNTLPPELQQKALAFCERLAEEEAAAREEATTDEATHA